MPTQTVKRMGWEGKIYTGDPGATAAFELQNARDITKSMAYSMGDTTTRGLGVGPPIETGRPSKRSPAVQWKMLDKEGDTLLVALLAASSAGTPVAIRTVNKAGGTGVDADFYITHSQGMPLDGEETIDFQTEKATDEYRSVGLHS
jgi:hypothetical protein